MSTPRALIARLSSSLGSGDVLASRALLAELVLTELNALDCEKLDALLSTHERTARLLAMSGPLQWAILGTYTTRPLRHLVRPLSLNEGFWATTYEGDFGSFRTEPLDAAAPLYRVRPDLVLIASSTDAIEEWPTAGDTEPRVAELVDQVIEFHRVRWRAIRSRTGARVIQQSFDPPSQRVLGRLEDAYVWSRTRFVRSLNERLWELDGREMTVLATDEAALDFGLSRWSPARWFHHSKHRFDPRLAYAYGRPLGGVLRAAMGRSKRCLVTDLDNVLWGGVIGDDGIDGIRLGPGSATGEAHAAFGQFLRDLRATGIALAVASRNDERVARAVFERHEGSTLKLSDFSAFVCNWESKSANLLRIARELNIGIDSLVFVDDEPFECEEVRRAQPAVTVVQLGDDPADFPRRIQELHLFDRLAITQEDLSRVPSYGALSLNSVPAADLGEYLAGLEMRASLDVAAPGDIARIEQLFGKTNQFNLTGKRYDRNDLAAAAEEGALVLACRFSDRLSNYGIVSALVVRFSGTEARIENWVMSCRVFSRTLEQGILSDLRELAKSRGARAIAIELIPTARNAYAQQALTALGLEAAGANRWVLSTDQVRGLVTFVEHAPAGTATRG